MRIPFLDLVRQHKRIEAEIDKAVRCVIKSSRFILGEEVSLFEREFACYCGCRFAVGLNSGTDALFLSLTAMGIGAGDEVIVPVFTFIATANAVTYTGARPVFVDIEGGTYNIDPQKIEKVITKKTKAIIPVHLFGQCADMDPITRIAAKYGLKVIEDACQAHGALYRSQVTSHKLQARKAGSMGDAGCFSFYPTKNLGGFGDGGLVVTDNLKLYESLKLLRDCGRNSSNRYEHSVLGYNSRLDTIQAAVLRVKLKYLEQWNCMRRYNAALYDNLLDDRLDLAKPLAAEYAEHVYHIYAVRVKKRDKTIEHLSAKGIGVMVNYPIPLHRQPAYKYLGYRKGDFPVAEKVCDEIISLPMHPFLSKSQIKYVVSALKKAMEE